MNYDLKSFGKRLLQIIEKRYLTQAEMARKAKMDKNNVSLYCTGKKRASPKTIVKICAVLDCSPDWLTMGKGSIDDTFQLSLISNLENMPNKTISATQINDFIEIRFSVSKKDFRIFMNDAQRDGCFA